MSATINDGGPIFPVASTPGYSTICVEDVGVVHRRHPGTAGSSGMSLRDYFAGQIAAGDAANPDGGSWGNSSTKETILARAHLYYVIADAMLEARGGQQ